MRWAARLAVFVAGAAVGLVAAGIARTAAAGGDHPLAELDVADEIGTARTREDPT